MPRIDIEKFGWFSLVAAAAVMLFILIQQGCKYEYETKKMKFESCVKIGGYVDRAEHCVVITQNPR